MGLIAYFLACVGETQTQISLNLSSARRSLHAKKQIIYSCHVQRQQRVATQKPGFEPTPLHLQCRLWRGGARDPFSRRFQGRRRTTAAAFLGGGGDFSPSRGMGHYLYHVQYTLLHNHKLFQTLLLSFLKASIAPYPDLPLSADITRRCSPLRNCR